MKYSDLPPAGGMGSRHGRIRSSGHHLVDPRRIPLRPASGAKVSPERRPLQDSSSANSILKASTLVEGRDSDVFVPRTGPARPVVISAISGGQRWTG